MFHSLVPLVRRLPVPAITKDVPRFPARNTSITLTIQLRYIVMAKFSIGILTGEFPFDLVLFTVTSLLPRYVPGYFREHNVPLSGENSLKSYALLLIIGQQYDA